MSHGALSSRIPTDRRVLFVAAVPAEARAICAGLGRSDLEPEIDWCAVEVNDWADMLVTGVGKANAAGACGHVIDPARHHAVVNAGVAGVLPRTKVKLGEVVLSTLSLFADEGVETPDGFTTVARMGFAPGAGTDLAGAMGVRPDPALAACLAGLVDHEGPVATVSTCSGRNRLAQVVASRTGAIAEAMEGAAAGFTTHRLLGHGVTSPFLEVRVISNTTGSRSRQRWDLKGAFARLTSFVEQL